MGKERVPPLRRPIRIRRSSRSRAKLIVAVAMKGMAMEREASHLGKGDHEARFMRAAASICIYFRWSPATGPLTETFPDKSGGHCHRLGRRYRMSSFYQSRID